jgi:anthranilate/para-aminobenzoate synthase component I
MPGPHRDPEGIQAILGLLGATGSGELKQPDMPFSLSRGWFGAFSYEFTSVLGRGQKGLDQDTGQKIQAAPRYHFFKPGVLLAYSRRTMELFSFGDDIPRDVPALGRGAIRFSDFSARISRERYEGMVREAKQYISNGDFYQANLAQLFTGHLQGEPAELYRSLRGLNPGPFMGIFQGRGFTLVSSSPERLVSGRDGWMESRPIAGTRPRGSSFEEDERSKAELLSDPKERAEHLMLVDLARNDLGRLADFGSVTVEDLARVESYAKVHHLVSIVKAKMRKGISMKGVMAALFPGGTITGCPKVRCMEVIRELEGSPRGFYTGSMGYFAPGPCFDLNILIRTFTLYLGGRFELYAGAGIVAESDPGREYMETLYKVESLAEALGTTLLRREQ